MNIHGLVERQVEQRLAHWYPLERVPPASGWLKTLRHALGITASQLAARLGITRQAIDDLETREQDGTATLATLRKAANAIDCDLVYALVPRTSVAELVQTQANRKATDEIMRVAHTMRLEDQGTASSEVSRLIEERADQLMRGSRRALWSAPDRSGHE